MNRHGCWKKTLPFALALVIGLASASIFQHENPNVLTAPAIKADFNDNAEPVVASLRVFSKPRPAYTEIARENQVQGIVTLRVTFLANGKIGEVLPISTLPDGLTESAIAAAKNIKFEPAKKDGVSYSVAKQVQYNFSIY